MGNACFGGSRKGGERLGSGGERSHHSGQSLGSSAPSSRSNSNGNVKAKGPAGDVAARDARLAAAEARAQASTSRGVSKSGTGGALAAKLEAQNAIGPGRLPPAERDGRHPADDWRGS
ncbi:hypothetical protein DFJ77DRAFT_552187 [Powellomyces hirtus]|nr:hypothetical protein DFJ77DRAFT_552187 [Powellomyces hirtus]